jgi:hypothetical protein
MEGSSGGKKLTISMDDGAYAALHRIIGQRFSRFLNGLAPPGCATTIPHADQATDKQREPDGCEWVGKPDQEYRQ